MTTALPSPLPVSAGDAFSLAVTSTGGALAWGDDELGELGNGQTSNTPVTTPVPVSLPWRATVTQVAAGVEDWGIAP
jgi:alpha-tubulin suppressor-like RCC1 family protein